MNFRANLWIGGILFAAVVVGGVGTLAVAGLWAFGFPQLRKIDSLEVPEPQAGK